MALPAYVYETYSAHPALRPYVEGYSVFRSVLPDEDCSRPLPGIRPTSRGFFYPGDPLIDTTIPSAHVMLMFSSAAPIRVQFDGAKAATPLASCVFGPATRTGKMDMASPVNFFGVMFRTGAARTFLNTPIQPLADTVLSLEDFWGARGRALERGLASTASVGQQIRRLEEELLRNARAAGPVDAKFQRLLTHVARSGGALTVESMSELAGVSRQHLARRFREVLGVSPKFYARTLRFHTLLAKMYSTNAPDWAALAADFGYYDQAHLIAEFKQFTGATPTEFGPPR